MMRVNTLLGRLFFFSSLVVSILFFAQEATSSASSYVVPDVGHITAHIPAADFVPEINLDCLVRSDQVGPNVSQRLMCYRTVGPSAPPPPPPPYENPPVILELSGTLNLGSGLLTTPIFDCIEFLPGVFAASLSLAIPLDKTGAGVSGQFLELITDTSVPFDCNEPVQYGSLMMTPLALNHDEDSDGCTDYNELGGFTDPFNPNDCESSVADILVHWPGVERVGFFSCIAKVDYNPLSNALRSAQQCNNDLPNWALPPNDDIPPTWEDTCEALADRIPPECIAGDLTVPGEPGPDLKAGPPPPPPYTLQAPSISSGTYFPGGAGAPPSANCGATNCSVVTSCFEDAGPVEGPGPNIIWTTVLLDPLNPSSMQLDLDGTGSTTVDGVTIGTVDIWYQQTRANCQAGTPWGAPTFDNLPVLSIQAYEAGGINPNGNPPPWRAAATSGAPGVPTVFDFDGDGCTDEDELVVVPGCGDDPYNPSDSFDPNTVDLSGAYDITLRVSQGDCSIESNCQGSPVPGEYLNCRSQLNHDIATDDVNVRLYCYHDKPGSVINPEAYPGVSGDGFAGAPPPGPDANPSPTIEDYVFGDVDTTHAELNGTFSRATGQITLTGCINDEDGFASLGNVYIVATLDAHQLPGTVEIWAGQASQCAGSPTGVSMAAEALITQQPGGGQRDSDQDGVPDSRELGDETKCGRRDPYNPYDYYDVSIPRDGVIDLPNDILGVQLHFAPGGYAAGDENWDRPPVMTGAGLGSIWNRGSPDGVIDLPNDILGVINQFNPAGCPDLS